MWIFAVWAVVIAIVASWVRRSELDGLTRAALMIGVICGPYWLIFYPELRKLPASTVFWRSAGVLLLGMMLGGLVVGMFKGGSSSYFHDEPSCYGGRYSDC